MIGSGLFAKRKAPNSGRYSTRHRLASTADLTVPVDASFRSGQDHPLGCRDPLAQHFKRLLSFLAMLDLLWM